MKTHTVYILIFSLQLCIFFSGGCNAANSLKPGIRPDMTIKNYKIINYKNNRIEFMLKADNASLYFNEKKSIAENIVLYYYKDDEENAVVHAKKAVMQTESKDIDLQGSVSITSTSGNRLITESIRWLNRENSLETDDSFKITRHNGDIITGTGLKADYNLERYEIKKNFYAESAEIVNGLINKKQKNAEN